MADGAATEVQPQGNAPAVKTRPPIDPAKREAAAAKAQLTRSLAKAKAAKNKEDAWVILEKEFGRKPEATNAAASDGAGSAQAQKMGPAPGWPTDEQIAAALPVTSQLWAQAKLALAGTPFQMDEARDVEIAVPDAKDPTVTVKRTVTIDPCGQLAAGTAPVFAKISNGAFTNPYALAGLTIAGVFGPPAARLGFGALQAWLNRPKQEKTTKVQNAPALPDAPQKGPAA